jgi:hypothetical protein
VDKTLVALNGMSDAAWTIQWARLIVMLSREALQSRREGYLWTSVLGDSPNWLDRPVGT